MNLTKEQAAKIHDIESYKAVTGAKRFKRTKEETAAGLSPEEALQARLDDLVPVNEIHVVTGKKKSKSKYLSGKELLTIRVRPDSKIPAEYFEKLKKKNIEVVLDDKFFGWVDNKLDHPYNGDVAKLFLHILNLGIGEVVTQVHSEQDVKEYK